jgi:hypothetical protein
MDHTIGAPGRIRNLQCRDCQETFSKPDDLAKHTEDVHDKKLESYACIPMKRGRGRPPKASFVNLGVYPPQVVISSYLIFNVTNFDLFHSAAEFQLLDILKNN